MYYELRQAWTPDRIDYEHDDEYAFDYDNEHEEERKSWLVFALG